MSRAAYVCRSCVPGSRSSASSFCRFRRLRQVHVEPRVGGAAHVLRLGVAAQRHQQRALERVVGPQGPRHLEAVEAREADVAEHDLRVDLPRLGEALGAVVGHGDLVRRELEHLAHGLGGVLVVFDDEHAPAAGRGVGRGLAAAVRGRGGEREGHRELRPLAQPAALHADLAAVQLDDALHQREPQAEAARAADQGRIGLHEGLEQAAEHLLAHARAGVDDPHEGARRPGVDRHRHPRAPAGAGELDRVLEEVADGLHQAVLVAVDPDRPGPSGVEQAHAALLEDRPLDPPRCAPPARRGRGARAGAGACSGRCASRRADRR